MEKSRDLTTSDQVVIDNEVTEVSSKAASRISPFKHAIDSGINKLKDLGASGSDEGTFDLGKMPPFYIHRDVKYLQNYSNLIQSWMGCVVEIEGEIFVGELHDLTNPGTKETAEFEIKDISPDDRKLVELGAVFYWTISEKMNNGQISKESFVRFQRLVKWTQEDFDKTADASKQFLGRLKFD